MKRFNVCFSKTLFRFRGFMSAGGWHVVTIWGINAIVLVRDNKDFSYLYKYSMMATDTKQDSQRKQGLYLFPLPFTLP